MSKLNQGFPNDTYLVEPKSFSGCFDQIASSIFLGGITAHNGLCEAEIPVVRKNRVRCSNQKLKDPFGVPRPDFIHVTNVTEPPVSC